MSRANVERVRRAYLAFNRGDYEAAIAYFHPRAEWYPYLGALEGSSIAGAKR